MTFYSPINAPGEFGNPSHSVAQAAFGRFVSEGVHGVYSVGPNPCFGMIPAGVTVTSNRGSNGNNGRLQTLDS